MEVGGSLIEQVYQTINERQPIPSKLLKKLFGPELPKAIAKLVEMDLIVLDELNQFSWVIKH